MYTYQLAVSSAGNFKWSPGNYYSAIIMTSKLNLIKIRLINFDFGKHLKILRVFADDFGVVRQIILAPRFSTLSSDRLFTVAQNHDTSPIIHLHRDNDTNVLGSGSRTGTAVPSRTPSRKSSGGTNWTWSTYWLRMLSLGCQKIFVRSVTAMN